MKTFHFSVVIFFFVNVLAGYMNSSPHISVLSFLLTAYILPGFNGLLGLIVK